MPEPVLLEASELTAIRKAEFAETLRARLSEKILAEIRLLSDTLEGAIARVVFEGKGADAVSENLAEFTTAVEAAISGWEAEPGNVAKLANTQRVGRLDVRGLAMIAITKVSKGRGTAPTGTEKGRTMTTTFTKSSDVLEAATREAEKLMKAAPEKYPNIVAARAQVWKDRSDLADAFASFPAETPTAPEKPIQKGQAAIDKATNIARELMTQHPDRFGSESDARAHVWRTRPDLAEAYQAEAYS